MLMLIQQTVQHFATLLANVLHLEVEVVDNTLHRVAGTGIYSQRLGQIPESNTLLLAEVMAKRSKVVVFDSRKNALCQACQQRERCNERGFVGVPVIYQQRCLGVISLIAVNNEQLWHLREHTSMFIEYIRHISTLLVANIDVLPRVGIGVDPLLAFLAQGLSQGVIVFDKRQRITFINDYARRQLNIVGDPATQSTRLVASTTSDSGEQMLSLHLNDVCWHLYGRWFDSSGSTVLHFSRCWQGEAETPDPDAPVIKTLIGNARAMRQLKALIGRVAASPSSVMILGESGTGKEVAAHAIHRLSPRHARPFVAINCAAIPENLLESELFGYAKGAFTGAAPAGKKGLIQLAHGGTLFLDEIGDMPLTLQARLLRAIESREIMPVGASQPVPVDIRIISATHQNLTDKIQQGLFREDLYYRLNVVPLLLPPLRQREGDVALLLKHFLALHAGKVGRRVAGVSPEVLRLLEAYRWPGNVRELSNLVEYLVNIVPEGEAIDSSLLPPVYHFPQPATTLPPHPFATAEPAGATTDMETAASLKSVEKNLIEEALLRSRNKKQAANELGIGVATLYRKIKKYGLQ
ncbi:sigma-54 interaction domain-containing protein [Mixta calida]|uniref:sigma-54 interaction domain-containing protein n=1 Tax=Mixta calida TaxID=665913 RepID=UPI00289BCDDD|nr:sigma 54-interacting transcriptional regulator [Mixta calida]